MTAVMCEDYCKRRDDGEINRLQGYKASNGESSGAWGGNWICIGVCQWSVMSRRNRSQALQFRVWLLVLPLEVMVESPLPPPCSIRHPQLLSS